MSVSIKAHKLSENIISLVSLKGLEYILNFLLLPFLVRTLGVERFGAIAFAQGLVQYFVILVDYGFNMTAPRDIAKARTSEEVGKIFVSVMASKILICIVTMGVFFASIFVFRLDKYIDLPLFFAVYIMVIGNIVFPIWFFQGIQQMRYITIVNVLARVITVSSIFWFVRVPEDYLLAAFLQACNMVIAGLFSYYVIFREYRFIFQRPNWKNIRETMIDGWQIFVSTIAINIYTTSNLVILGFITNNTVVGYFSAANKIIDSIKGIMTTVTQAVYPHVSNILRDSRNTAILFLRKFIKIYCGVSFIGSITLFMFACLVVKILFGNGYNETKILLQIMSILPFIISISNVYGVQIMLNFGWQKDFSKILVCAAVFNIFIVVPLTMFWQGTGVVISMILTELLVTVCTFFYVQKLKQIKIFWIK